MNHESNPVPVDVATDNQQTAEQPLCDENQELRNYYLRQFRQLCPHLVKDKSDEAQLAALKVRITELVKMLTGFSRSWAEEIPVLHKACLSYLGTENLSRKEQQQVVNVPDFCYFYLFVEMKKPCKRLIYRILLAFALILSEETGLSGKDSPHKGPRRKEIQTTIPVEY